MPNLTHAGNVKKRDDYGTSSSLSKERLSMSIEETNGEVGKGTLHAL
jgi:hypothetical protein